jgi:hypothetical protein
MKTEEEQKMSEMQAGAPYVVTRGSKDGEFRKGDRIVLMSGGDIVLPSFGLMHAADVPEATRGMRVCPIPQEDEE